MTNQIILRHAKSDFDCLMVAQGMEDAGATVISVSPCYPNTDMMKFMVIARYNNEETTPDKIDDQIHLQLFHEE
jgi:hypothetical protein